MASGFLGFLGKKKQADAPPSPSVPVVRGPVSHLPPGAPLPPGAGNTAPIPGGTARPPGSQPLFERARKRVTQRLSLAGLNSGSGSAKIKIPAAEAAAPVAPPPVAEHAEAVLDLPASVVIPLLPETVLLADPASLLASPQGQMDFRLPLASVLPMLPSGKIEFSIGDLTQCGPEGIIHPFESLGEWASQTVLLPLPQVVMRISPDFMTLRRDQKPIDTAVASMDDPFSPEALRAKAEAAMAAQAAAEAVVAPEVVSAPEPVVAEIPPMTAAEETVPEPAAVVEDAPVPTLAVSAPEDAVPEEAAPPGFPAIGVNSSAGDEPDFSFTQSPEYQALLSKLQTAEEAPEAGAAEESVPDLAPAAAAEAESFAPVEAAVPVAKPPLAFSFPSKTVPKAEPEPVEEDEPMPASPVSAAITASPSLSGAFNQAIRGLGGPKAGEGKPVGEASDLHRLLRLPEGIPAGFKEFTHQLALWPGLRGCVICGPDGLPIASGGGAGKSGESLAALAPRLFKNASVLLSDLGRPELNEMNLPGDTDSVTLFRNSHFILVVVHEDEQLPVIYRKNIREALALIAHSGPG